ncbi:hypothetical protein DPEC_G00098050 [Dallia pectoralis]|uniref:Uncharacterized protein n=1 Tax=Dallia pectoralis TaxID=75939 RepID=A0ACC2GWM2_DALPE|nr:hypothetical protein DPEC_G00098050 [Dallia pectoralis]
MDHIFTISDESEGSDVDETNIELDDGPKKTASRLGQSLNLPVDGRLRTTSSSEIGVVPQHGGQRLDSVATGESPFRVRSQSAPPALWAAKRYGRQLRRMSDEFDTWLDKGEMKRVRSAGAAKQMTASPSWWAFLFSQKETETENTPNLTATQPRSSE